MAHDNDQLEGHCRRTQFEVEIIDSEEKTVDFVNKTFNYEKEKISVEEERKGNH